MRPHDRSPNEARAPTPATRTPDAAPNALELAATIGNSAMQRVADSATLQRSPAGAHLLSGQPSTLARMTEEEEEDVGGDTGVEVSEPDEPAGLEAGAAAESVVEPGPAQATPEEDDREQ